MGVSVDNDVINNGNVLGIKAGTESAMPAARKSLYVATDTERLYYRDALGNAILLTGSGGGGGGGATPPTFDNTEFSI